ncbi:MAG TPA: cryptochrome/photolyase family protein [Caldimonas sp.]|jgi:deoxyribodipyrimidine photolyase-related protein|nr:cryptochrome/photolyase family protein [Caldimonas sp.]HEX2540821.1 cryptochrome/photolyase family protein [Caldimonas sp.]
MIRNLVLVLGDQLSHASPALAGFDAARDAVLMIEAPGEATHAWSHKARIAIFLAAMRHFRDELRSRGRTVHYVELDASDAPALADRLRAALQRHRPQVLRLVEPGEWRLLQAVRSVAAAAGVAVQFLDDAHFFCSRADFARWAGPAARRLRMENFYRHMRVAHAVLLDAEGAPEGGRWNFDSENRKGWPKSPPGRAGPGLIPPPARVEPDALTLEIIGLVEQRFGEHPGSLKEFAWPVTRADALAALDVFVRTRLRGFGEFQDAMWTDTPFGWHALLSSSLNLHLLDPREVVAAAEAAYRRGDAPLPAVEGFIRQILGWREFIRGVYWRDMPGMADANRLEAGRPLPQWYWTAETKMNCAREAIGQTLRHGYAHHIQRLMVTGLFGLLAEIEPKQVADWYLAVYVDAIEWAELPNVAGMALWADGGRFTSKPYIASGAYIDKMSNYCRGCTYAPTEKAAATSGKPLCPFTVLYWHFVDKHAALLARNPRTLFNVRQLEQWSQEQRQTLRERAADMLQDLDRL